MPSCLGAFLRCPFCLECPVPFLRWTNFYGVSGGSINLLFKEKHSPATLLSPGACLSPRCVTSVIVARISIATSITYCPSLGLSAPQGQARVCVLHHMLPRAWLSACMAQKQPASILTAERVKECTRGFSFTQRKPNRHVHAKIFHSRIEVQDREPTLHRG